MSLTFSKLRAKLGLKPLEVNAVKKGEYGADDEGNEEVTKGSGVRTQVQHQLTALCVRARVCMHARRAVTHRHGAPPYGHSGDLTVSSFFKFENLALPLWLSGSIRWAERCA